MLNLIKRLVKEEEGQGLVEYALIIVLISLVAVGTMLLVGQQINSVFGDIHTQLGGTP